MTFFLFNNTEKWTVSSLLSYYESLQRNYKEAVGFGRGAAKASFDRMHNFDGEDDTSTNFYGGFDSKSMAREEKSKHAPVSRAAIEEALIYLYERGFLLFGKPKEPPLTSKALSPTTSTRTTSESAAQLQYGFEALFYDTHILPLCIRLLQV
jgi:hypothetical protein